MLLLPKTKKQEGCEKLYNDDSGQLSNFLDLQGCLVVRSVCQLPNIVPDRGQNVSLSWNGIVQCEGYTPDCHGYGTSSQVIE